MSLGLPLTFLDTSNYDGRGLEFSLNREVAGGHGDLVLQVEPALPPSPESDQPSLGSHSATTPLRASVSLLCSRRSGIVPASYFAVLHVNFLAHIMFSSLFVHMDTFPERTLLAYTFFKQLLSESLHHFTL